MEDFTPKSITVDGNTLAQRKLSTKVVKELLIVRQKDSEKYPPLDNISWLASWAFFGDDKHSDDVDGVVAYEDMEPLFTNILQYNSLLKTVPGEVAATVDQTA